MTLTLATALLNRAANGADLLAILETLTAEIQQENIDDAAAHFATLQEIQF